MRFLEDPVRLIMSVLALLWALTFHEFCHGLAAYLCGDSTAKRSGRLSLNPLAHLDLVGTLMLLIFHFGWAKPVEINSMYFKNPRRDLIIVSLAGVVGNFLTAFLAVLFFRYCSSWWWNLTGKTGIIFLQEMTAINLGLAAFNLIPIPPLDGSRVLEALLPYEYLYIYEWLERYGLIIIFALVFTGAINIFFDPIINFLLKLLP